MSHHPNQPPSHNSQEYDGPSLTLELNGISVELTWINTVLRTFQTGYGVYDHLEYTNEAGELVGVTLDFKGGEEVKQMLIEYNFPIRTDPMVDAKTDGWFSDLQTRRIDREWSAFELPQTDEPTTH